MEVKNITIGGFKNLAKTKIDLNKITALVSPNNYGKSNFLIAINFAINFIKGGERDRKRMMAMIQAIPLTPSLENEPFYFEIELHDPSLKTYQFIRYGFSFKWIRDDKTGQKIIDEWLDMRENESTKYTGYLKRAESKYRKGKSTNAFRKINLNNFQLALDILSSVEDIEYLEALNALKMFSFKSCSLLDMDKPYTQFPYEFRDEEFSLQNEEDLHKMLYNLKERDSERFNLFKEAITSLFDDIIDIEVTKTKIEPQNHRLQVFSVGENKNKYGHSDETIPFRLKSETYKIFVLSKYINQPIEITMLSSGTKRLIWILAILFTSKSSIQLISIEELETSIHPNLLKKTLGIIYEYLDESKLIITSHSPFLIQYLDINCIYIGLPSINGVATFKNITKGRVKTLINSANDNDLSVGEYLFDLMSNNLKSKEILKYFVGL